MTYISAVVVSLSLEPSQLYDSFTILMPGRQLMRRLYAYRVAWMGVYLIWRCGYGVGGTCLKILSRVASYHVREPSRSCLARAISVKESFGARSGFTYSLAVGFLLMLLFRAC